MMHRLVVLLGVLCASVAGAADPAPTYRSEDTPAELRAWVDWVRARQPGLACPVVAGARACVWPGVLEVQVRGATARLRLEVTTDTEARVDLPGGTGSWPQDLRLDGTPAAVVPTGGLPGVVLPPGSHTVTWALQWTHRPASLALPAAIGRIELVVDGVGVALPRIDGDGLHLGAVEVDAREGERLDLEVARRVSDGVPVAVETEVTLRASGRAREVDLGDVLLPGTRAVALEATLPARFTDAGTLLVQVRPGTWTVRFVALHEGAVASLARPPALAPWPEVETWVFVPDEQARAVEVSGPPGVDPARTTLPAAWRSHAAFAVDARTPLVLTELRRGDPEPPPNALSLHRTLWVDVDGGGFTVRDHFWGTMSQGWRLEAADDADLGHATAGGTDLVVTRLSGGGPGVELRSSGVDLTAESRHARRPAALSAVGWNTDVRELGITLNLPPGWSLLAATGVDSLDGSVLDRWTLFDLFFVLVLALATARLLDWQWGAFMLALLVLTRHVPDAPEWSWALLLVVLALGRVVKGPGGTRALTAARGVVVVALVVVLLPFVRDQLRGALFPALQDGYAMAVPGDARDGFNEHKAYRSAATPSMDSLDYAMEEVSEAGQGLTAIIPRSARAPKKLAAQVDPNAAVQTGPGVPAWSWSSLELTWSGPVGAEHALHLYLLGPQLNLALALLRVALAVLLLLRLGGVPLGRWLRAPPVAATLAAGLALFLTPTPAQAEPSKALLDELEARLTAPPACDPCVDVPRLALGVDGDTLSMDAEVHAEVAGAWPVPGPTKTWVPARVLVDGKATTALARLSDGHLHVRLEPGVHAVRAEGALPASDAVVLAFGLRPHLLTWDAPGWVLDGVKADGTPDASVQLARVVGTTTGTGSAEDLSPWLQVTRSLDLGIPWRVRTEVRRVGPSSEALALRVPLLPGEAVTEGGFEPMDGVLPVTLARDQQQVAWISTLEAVDLLQLTAPEGVPWTEVWELSCSPIFSCAPAGLPPVAHADYGTWQPTWKPWPGERLTVEVSRPAGVEGQTTTVDAVTLRVRPGRRQLEATLDLQLRSSQGGRQVLTLPEGAVLQQVTIDGISRPLRLTDGTLALPVQPGSQAIEVRWQQERAATVYDVVPAVDLGGPAVNVTVIVETPPERWIAALRGPLWGPVPLYWTYLLVVAGCAWLLARVPWSPLGLSSWLLLGLGMTQLPAFCPVAVALWLVALGWRRARPLEQPLLFDALQVGLVVLTLVALVCLYAAIHTGLLLQPDMQVAGNGSYAGELNWFVDRIDGALPQPAILWFPMWTWRVAMLLWSLWLAASLVRWLPWAFGAWTEGGWIKRLSRARRPPAPEAPPP